MTNFSNQLIDPQLINGIYCMMLSLFKTVPKSTPSIYTPDFQERDWIEKYSSNCGLIEPKKQRIGTHKNKKKEPIHALSCEFRNVPNWDQLTIQSTSTEKSGSAGFCNALTMLEPDPECWWKLLLELEPISVSYTPHPDLEDWVRASEKTWEFSLAMSSASSLRRLNRRHAACMKHAPHVRQWCE